MGKRFKCSCYLLNNNKIVKRCNQYFTFTKKVIFSNCTYFIDGKEKYCGKGKFDEYNLEKENVKYISKKGNGFYIK